MSILFIALLSFFYKKHVTGGSKKATVNITLIYLAWYILFSNLISAIWLTPKFVSQHLYWINWLVLAIFLYKNQPVSAGVHDEAPSEVYTSTLLKWWLAALVIILIVSYIAVTVTPGRPNAQLRF